MAVPLGAAFLIAAILFGLALCWLGLYCFRRWDEPGATPFAVMAVIFGVGAIAGGLVALARGTNVPETAVPLWLDLGLLAWAVAMVPWFLFVLQYTGRHLEFGRSTVAVLAAPVLFIYVILGMETIGVTQTTVVTQLLGTLALLYTLALVTVGSYLLLRTTYDYGHLSLAQGAILTMAGIGPLVLINSVGTLTGETSDATVFGVYAVAFVVPAVALSLAVFRYRMFEVTPAMGALGERAIPRETDDLMFVVDRADRVIKLNETAAETLAVPRSDPLGDSFSSLTETTVDALETADIVELETGAGKRKFDPQVTAFTDQHDRRLGSLLSLRDITERELREQRLEVMNRVLRHNLRNRIDVIEGNAEALADETDSEHVEPIRDSAAELAELSAKARATDQLVSRQSTKSRADLSAVVRELATDADTDVTLEIPESASLVTDWVALRAALESAIENAAEHGADAVQITIEQFDGGYEVVVADDGPGIPESELASLEAETETPLQHGTGLGLWQLTWGVTKLNGELSFDTTDGTTVRVKVPDRST